MKIVVLDGYTVNPGDNPFDALHKLGQVTVFDRTSPGELLERASAADVIIVNKFRIDSQALAQLPNLKLIVVSATGYDCVDVAAATAFGVLVANVPEYGTAFVAQHTIALLLELCHHVGAHDLEVQQGGWCRCPDFSFWSTPMIELEGQTLGLFGVGKIGSRVAEIAHAIGMNILGHSRQRRQQPKVSRFEWVDADELFARSRVISLHCPLTEETRELVNHARLNQMPRGSMLINTARGGLIREHDLINALSEGQLAGAAIDVLATEPMPVNHPYLSARNLIITPHQAWASLSARRRLLNVVVANINAFANGQPINIVNQ